MASVLSTALSHSWQRACPSARCPMGCVSAQAIATEISRDETNHVAFLRGALGAEAVPIPLVSNISCSLPR